MPKPYSVDLRERVVACALARAPVRAVAARFGVNAASVVCWAQRQRRSGDVAPGRIGGHRRRRLRGETRLGSKPA